MIFYFYFQLALAPLRFFIHHFCKICSECERKKYITWKDGCRTNAEDELYGLEHKRPQTEAQPPDEKSANSLFPMMIHLHLSLTFSE